MDQSSSKTELSPEGKNSSCLLYSQQSQSIGQDRYTSVQHDPAWSCDLYRRSPWLRRCASVEQPGRLWSPRYFINHRGCWLPFHNWLPACYELRSDVCDLRCVNEVYSRLHTYLMLLVDLHVPQRLTGKRAPIRATRGTVSRLQLRIASADPADIPRLKELHKQLARYLVWKWILLESEIASSSETSRFLATLPLC